MTTTTPIGPQVRIRDLREAHGMSVAQLVDRIEEQGVCVHPDTVRNVELGHRRASRPLITAWSKALGIPVLDIWQPAAASTKTAKAAA